MNRAKEALLLECRDRLARLPGLGGADGLRQFPVACAVPFSTAWHHPP